MADLDCSLINRTLFAEIEGKYFLELVLRATTRSLHAAASV